MYKDFLRKLLNMLQLIFERLLTTNQKNLIKNILTEQQKYFVKDLLKGGKRQTQLRQIAHVKYRLYNLGFTERAYDDLTNMFLTSEDQYLKKLAAWELALWHANQHSKEDARKCVKFLTEALHQENDIERLRRTAILKAESLEVLGEVEEAKQVLLDTLAGDEHADLYLAYVNLESSVTKRIESINKALAMYRLAPMSLNKCSDKLAYDRLLVKQVNGERSNKLDRSPKVSVIIPVYNAEDVIQTTLDSILTQTWTNLEVLVVDDCSTDDTVEIIKEYINKNSRVQLIRTKVNGGAYVARNHALKQATGTFATLEVPVGVLR